MKEVCSINWAQLYKKKNYSLICFENNNNINMYFYCVKEIFLKWKIFNINNKSYIIITESDVLTKGIGEGTIGFDFKIVLGDKEYLGEINYTFDRDLFPLLTL